MKISQLIEAKSNVYPALKPVELAHLYDTSLLAWQELTAYITKNSSVPIGPKHLYRGLNIRGVSLPPVFVSQSMNNRNAMNTYDAVHNAINSALKNAGFAARRDNSIFCSSSIGDASMYGSRTYVIFPLKGFNYSWSAKLRDFTSDLHVDPEDAEGDWDGDHLGGPTKFIRKVLKSIQTDPQKFLQKYKFMNNAGLDQALLKEHEVCVQGKYLAVDATWFDKLWSKFSAK